MFFSHQRRAAAACLLLAVVVAPLGRAEEVDRGYQAAVNSITVEELTQYVERLASAEFEGREAGTRGGYKAAAFLAAEYQKLRLRGGAREGSYYQAFVPNYRNVLAELPGREADATSQAVVVGAHYDHLGYGTSQSSRGPTGYLHPGADDNASGLAALLEVAEAMTHLPRAPRRRVLFIAFDGEEKGLLGSRHWAAYPTVPIAWIAAMINVDMIGRLRDEKLTVQGVRSGYGWRRWLSEINGEDGLLLDFNWQFADDADHHPFWQRRAPVLTLHTGMHDEYHTPYDRPALINGHGMQRVARLLFAMVYRLAEQEQVPAFRPYAAYESEETRKAIERRVPVVNGPMRVGIAWRGDEAEPGVAIVTYVAPGLPAYKAGLVRGDRVHQVDGRDFAGDAEFGQRLRLAGETATLTVERAGRVRRVAIELPGTE